MKKLLMISATLLISCIFFTAYAQNRNEGNWKEKVQSEKIAFLTMEMDITPEEAQVFWPVYNMVQKEMDAAFQEVIKAHKELASAADTDDTDNIAACLDKYLQAQSKLQEVKAKATAEYNKVLPVKKVAKLYLSEEKFRRQHIRRLHDGRKHGHTPEASGK